MKLADNFVDISWSAEVKKTPRGTSFLRLQERNKYWWIPGNCIFQAVSFLLRYKMCLQHFSAWHRWLQVEVEKPVWGLQTLLSSARLELDLCGCHWYQWRTRTHVLVAAGMGNVNLTCRWSLLLTFLIYWSVDQVRVLSGLVFSGKGMFTFICLTSWLKFYKKLNRKRTV